MTEASLKADWYFDILSPFAYLQLQEFHRFPDSLTVTPKPVVLGAILKHWGQIGPAEIAPKRVQTYRTVQFRADTRGVPFNVPPRHPYNPLMALRLLCALGPDWATVRAAFNYSFRDGLPLETPDDIEALGKLLGVNGSAVELASAQEAKDRLRANTDEALERGVYGVPTFSCEGELFWGDDSTDMFIAWLADRDLFSRGGMARIRDLPVGAVRNR
ncbi:MAG: 2-hydroxychromene-2-carboxylate isomerase [Rhizobiaceae bacterium]|nr:2-hydroxychromene-2-carboxylate isomerase [Rhizobiaceae bacterium]MCV0408737.1 2-hydroxychromene-2-carboxylate isomerase [Rhizobiaceae bacterium]